MKNYLSKINTQRIGIASSVTFLFQVSLFGIGFLSSVILARVLGPSGRGVYALIFLIALVLTKIGSLGIEVSNVYFGAKPNVNFNNLTGNSVLTGTLLGGLILVLSAVLLLLPSIKDYLSRNQVSMFILFLALFTVPLNLLIANFTGLLQGKGKILEFNFLSISVIGLQFVLLLFFLFLFNWGLNGAVWANVLASAGGFLIAFYLIKRILLGPISYDKALFKISLNYAGKAYFANLAQFLNYRLDQFLVSFFLGSMALGYYAVAVTLVERIWLIPQSIAIILFPRTSASESDDANSITPLLARNMFFLLVVMTLLLGLLAKPAIILLFGYDYLSAVAPLVLLLPGVVALGFGKILMSDLLGRGKPQIGLLASLLSLVITLILDLILIPILGIRGAAIASSVAYFFSAFVITIAFVMETRIPVNKLIVLQVDDIHAYLSLLKRLSAHINLSRV